VACVDQACATNVNTNLVPCEDGAVNLGLRSIDGDASITSGDVCTADGQRGVVTADAYAGGRIVRELAAENGDNRGVRIVVADQDAGGIAGNVIIPAEVGFTSARKEGRYQHAGRGRSVTGDSQVVRDLVVNEVDLGACPNFNAVVQPVAYSLARVLAVANRCSRSGPLDQNANASNCLERAIGYDEFTAHTPAAVAIGTGTASHRPSEALDSNSTVRAS